MTQFVTPSSIFPK